MPAVQQRPGALGGRRAMGMGCQEIYMPVQPMLNHIPLKEALGIKTDKKKTKVLPAPRPPVAAVVVAKEKYVACPRFGPVGAEEGREVCSQCRLPLGDLGYAADGEGRSLIHGECKAQLILKDMQKADEARLKKEAALKRERRAKYDIGWKVQRVPRNAAGASKLGCTSLPQGMCALVWRPETKSLAIVPTADAAASINLEYLSLALRVRKQDGREPMFSLDPKIEEVSSKHKLWQVKRFEPAWLDGTSIGEVMFQADYHLKELSMGEGAQPVSGMRSALDYSEEQGLEKEWSAREWFIVNSAEIELSKEGVVTTRVEMGVEARETFKGESGLEDVPITRPDHPLVKYAEAFTHNFELIAERRSVVRHLRELAKAAVLAKFLVENKADLSEEWFGLADLSAGPSAHREIPQLWNEQRLSQIQVEDGRIVSSAEGVERASKMYGVYGGVDGGIDQLQRVGVPVGRVPTAKVSMARAPNLSQRLIQARTGLAEMPLEAPGAMPGAPKGVDLNLEKFDLDAAVADESAKPEGSWGGEEFVGRAFWKNLAGSAFKEDDAAMLKALFNSQMCDRREDCEIFVPPATDRTHVQKLRKLLEEEAAVREQRKAAFLSADFAPEESSLIFPGWRLAGAPAARGQMHARPECAAEAADFVKFAAPSSARRTEDGTFFRIYQLGSLEVRTIEEPGSQEAVAAVFSSQGAPASAEGAWSTVAKTDKIVKAVLYVEEVAVEQGALSPSCHFFTMLETDQGDAIAAELLADGSLAWAENPAELEARRARAKVLRAVDSCGAKLAVQDFRARLDAKAAAGDSRRLAEAALLLAAPAREKAWAALGEAELREAGQLGVSGAEGWDAREAAVFGLGWSHLSGEQRLAAEALGFGQACWRDPVPKKEEAPAAPPAERSATERLGEMTKAEQEAMMEAWVKQTYGIGASA